ncbi:MAG: NAD-dependent malic enzyme [Alphaproteobacteria bacterium]|nr:NAD-dependent malic enzyme [Alphaproteobacteria bacterium]
MTQSTVAPHIELDLHGGQLLDNPLYNKGTAFSKDERKEFDLVGLLPPHIDDMETQAERAYAAYQRKTEDLERHIFLRGLQDTNETLFYRLVLDHLPEMMPMIYTPVVGAACQQFSEIYRRPRGLFISYPEREKIDVMLDNAPVPNVEAIVVTDGERILGLGDQGAGGMGIPIGKLSLYTACGGITPTGTLPILLDVGTNNEERLNDPMYVGWRHERVTGDDYYDFVDMFVQAVKRKFPHVLLQFEDFAQTHAAPLLAKYRDQLCTFNDDIQGTAAVTVGTLLAACKVTGGKLSGQTVAMFGAGSAGCGIAEQMVAAMVREGLSEKDARARFYMIDRPGLLHDKVEDLLPFQTKLLQPHDKVASWGTGKGGEITFLDVIKNAHPTILIGVSGQPGKFTEEIIREMASHTDRPIIFPLSNPTSRIEGVPADLISWTDGRALIATGSPFGPVDFKGHTYPVAQCNNSYIFPAMGLGILGIGARRVSDGMFMAASEELSRHAPALKNPEGSLLPSLEQVREISADIAYAVAAQAQSEGLAEDTPKSEMKERVDAKRWQPVYSALKRRSRN